MPSGTQLDVTEWALVVEALERAGGNAAEAARLLGISRIMLVKRMARFGIAAPAGSGRPRQS